MRALKRIIISGKKYAIHQMMRWRCSRRQREFVALRVLQANQNITQLQHAWFDYQRTLSIKMNIFILDRTGDLLRHWFNLKRHSSTKWHFKKLHRLSMENIFGVTPT